MVIWYLGCVSLESRDLNVQYTVRIHTDLKNTQKRIYERSLVLAEKKFGKDTYVQINGFEPRYLGAYAWTGQIIL